MLKIFLLFFVLLLNSVASVVYAETFYQTIRGVVVDKSTQVPLPGANIIVASTNPQTGTVSGHDGSFELKNIKNGSSYPLYFFHRLSHTMSGKPYG